MRTESMNYGRVLAVLVLAPILICTTAWADEKAATIGVSRSLQSVVLPAPELVVKPLDTNSPLVLRITATFPHGTSFRYDFEYYALETGSFNLSDYLVAKDGTEVELPELRVEVTSLLEPGQVTPNTLEQGDVPDVGGYTALLIGGCVAWVVGLGFLIFWRRKKVVSEETDAREITLAERLRPLVEDVIRGELPRERLAELERTLFAYWRDRLGLGETDAADAIREMRSHPEAGALLRELEQWLHRPPGSAGEVDVNALLKPYSELSNVTSGS